MRRPAALALAALGLLQAGPASAQTAVVDYRCDKGQVIRVEYNLVSKLRQALVTTEKWRWVMFQVPTESGIRYASKEKPLEWASKGKDGILINTRTHQMIYCKEVSSR